MLTEQKPASLFIPTESLPQGGGAILVRPGKPVSRLTPKMFAEAFGVDRDTVYRWRTEGLIDESFIEAAGKRKILISAEAVQVLRAKFKKDLEER
jgi:hypothetical protein